MRKVLPMEEAEIASVAKFLMEYQSWDLYPEVVLNFFAGRPDYVALRNNICHVIECKKTLTYPVIEQLARWQLDAEARKQWRGQKDNILIPHLLSAWVMRTDGARTPLKQKLLNEYRIGLYTVEKEICSRYDASEEDGVVSFSNSFWKVKLGDYEYSVYEEIPPKLQPGSRQTAHRIIEQLNDDMKLATAGVKGGETEYMTPFKRTMNRVRELMSDGKQRHISHILEGIAPLGGHHYSNDRSAANQIVKFIEKLGIAERTKEYGPWFTAVKKRL